MSRFGAFPTPRSFFHEPLDSPITESSWDTAKRITDNRLRAMRWWYEGEHKERIAKMKWLRANLVRLLIELDGEARRSYDDRLAARIHTLVDHVKNLSTSGSSPFKETYALIGLPVPETVRGGSAFIPPWARAGYYEMAVARDIVRSDPSM